MSKISKPLHFHFAALCLEAIGEGMQVVAMLSRRILVMFLFVLASQRAQGVTIT